MSVENLFEILWDNYSMITPQASQVHQILEARGETVLNDHIALRTVNHEKVNIDILSQVFLKNGFVKKKHYSFEEKKLDAFYFQHPNISLPKVFISELKLEEFSDELQDFFNSMIKEIPSQILGNEQFCCSGRNWNISYKTYQKLRKESEYAAWLAVFGYRANHFTVNVNALNSFADIATLNTFLKKNGFKLNQAGGEIKGGKKALLSQSSTLATEIEVDLFDGLYKIPSCYYEFAQRFKMPNGQYFQGFVAGSADKIFESTDSR